MNQLLLNTFIGHKPNAFWPPCWPSSVVKILIRLYMVQQNFFSYNKKIVEPYIDVLVFLPLMMANMVAETRLV
jgi:hypothetical protein